ncbi:MAG: hypothetical protein GF355_04790 [Candidatus Eisenbacteria bacterium]|nr:hypothetical protein [Candidatus Eisenbacteria bacterium]
MMDTICGVEITLEDIKYAVLERHGRRHRAVSHGRVELDGSAAPGSVLAELIGSGRLPGKDLRLALGTQTALMKVRSFPGMPRKDLDRVLANEIQHEMEILPDEFLSRYEILSHPGKSSPYEVLITLTPRRGVAEIEEDLDRHGVAPTLLTLSSSALLAHVRGAGASPAAGTARGILYIASRLMVLAIIEGSSIRLVRDVGVGMTAESLEGDSKNDSTKTPDWDLDQIGRMLDDITQIAQQIRRTLEYDSRSHPNDAVEGLLLSGDIARAREIAPILQNEVGLPVEILDPLQGLELGRESGSLQEDGPAYTLPIALAMAADPHVLPDLRSGVRPKALRRRPRLAVAGVWAVAALMMMTVAVTQNRLEDLQADRERLLRARPAPETAEPAESPGQTLLSELGGVEGAIPLKGLHTLIEALPAEVVLDRLSVTRDGLVVRAEGEIRAATAQRRLEIWGELQDRLLSRPELRSVTFDPLQRVSSSSAASLPVGLTAEVQS